jgi:uncharacterized coiled-coil protein SlyX
MGVRSDDKDNLYEKRKLVNARIKELDIEINNHEQSIGPISNKFTALSNKVKHTKDIISLITQKEWQQN